MSHNHCHQLCYLILFLQIRELRMHLEHPSGPLYGHWDPAGEEQSCGRLASRNLQRFQDEPGWRTHGNKLILNLIKLVLYPHLLGLGEAERHHLWNIRLRLAFDRPIFENNFHLGPIRQSLFHRNTNAVKLPLHFDAWFDAWNHITENIQKSPKSGYTGAQWVDNWTYLHLLYGASRSFSTWWCKFAGPNSFRASNNGLKSLHNFSKEFMFQQNKFFSIGPWCKISTTVSRSSSSTTQFRPLERSMSWRPNWSKLFASSKAASTAATSLSLSFMASVVCKRSRLATRPVSLSEAGMRSATRNAFMT